MSKRLESLVKELFEIVDKVEYSNGRYFHPTSLQFASCRVMDGVRLNVIIGEMKHIVDAPPRATEKELLLNGNPNACIDCMGTGDVGRNQHERQWDECPHCEGSGTIEPKEEALE